MKNMAKILASRFDHDYMGSFRAHFLSFVPSSVILLKSHIQAQVTVRPESLDKCVSFAESTVSSSRVNPVILVTKKQARYWYVKS